VLRGNLLTQTPEHATSATLTVGKSFDAIAKNIGFVIAGKNDVENDVTTKKDSTSIDCYMKISSKKTEKHNHKQ
jgi:ATP-dependent DNA helicase DinG